MQDQGDERIPRTARDALIIELLGDLGSIHDQIKNLPAEIEKAVGGSLTVIADAVEDAEKTTLQLAQSIDIRKDTVTRDIDIAVQNSLEKHAAQTFSKMDEKVKNLQHKINRFELADPKGRRLSLILAVTIVLLIFLSSAAIYGIYSGANTKIDELNFIISTQDKMEKKGLSVLSPEARSQYQSAIQNTQSN